MTSVTSGPIFILKERYIPMKPRRKDPKGERLQVRFSKQEKELIRKAAELKGNDYLGEFVRRAAVDEALRLTETTQTLAG